MLRYGLFAGLLVATLATAPAQIGTVTPYGQGCGPVATGFVAANGATSKFTFTVDATPRSRVLLVVGVNELAIPLPTTTCFLLTEPAFTQQHMTDHAGQWSFSHAIPDGTHFTGYARVQFIQVDFGVDGTISLLPSNGLFMDCTGG